MWLKQVTYQGRSWVHFDDAHNWGRYNKGVSPAISNDVVMWLKQVTYQGRSCVHFDDAHNWGRYNKGVSPAISNDVSDVGTPEKMLKARTRNGTFWCNLNQSFW